MLKTLFKTKNKSNDVKISPVIFAAIIFISKNSYKNKSEALDINGLTRLKKKNNWKKFFLSWNTKIFIMVAVSMTMMSLIKKFKISGSMRARNWKKLNKYNSMR